MRQVRRPMLAASLAGAAVGLFYGVLARLAFDHRQVAWLKTAFAAMSVAFLFLVPLALGALVVWLASIPGRRSVAYWILAPWVPCLAVMAVVTALAWEGWICVVMAAPVFLFMASLGGAAVGLLGYYRARASGTAAVTLALLPFLFAPLEQRLGVPEQRREVTTTVEIAAPAEVVWRQVIRVPEIRPGEQPRGFFQAIGIPRPLEATLDREAAGGVRQARFVGGIRFLEAIDEWDPPRALGFHVAVDRSSIRPDVLDRHVLVGGDYFDVEHGRFRLDPLGPVRVRLVLTSRHRLDTHLNVYAGLWTDAVMRDLQLGICRVIKARSEKEAS